MKNIAKTLVALMLVLCLLSMFVACGGNTDDTPDTPDTENTDPTPDNKPNTTPDDGNKNPTPEPAPKLNEDGANTESGWSDMK